MTGMKKRISIIGVMLVLLAGYYFCSMALFIHGVENAFPELQGRPTRLYLPWPLGPKWISSVPANHPLYRQGHGGSVRRAGYHVVVMPSDGTVIATTQNKP